MRVNDLVTQHPGGWNDIVAATRAYAPNFVVSSSQLRWVLDFIVTKKKGLEMPSPAKVFVPGEYMVEERKLVDILDSDFVGASGSIASGIFRIFIKYGIPVPGDKEWLKPASTWSIWRNL